MSNFLIGIIGPTAVGKTQLATQLAFKLNGEILSADSRQVYRGMDIGTGKDYDDYYINGKQIPYHLIDIVYAGEEYNVFQFQKDFFEVYKKVLNKGKQPILCGGTGMYIEAAIRKHTFVEVPENSILRKKLSNENITDLQIFLKKLKPNLHNSSDLLDRDRLIRAIEIEEFIKNHPKEEKASPVEQYILFGLKTERDKLRERIAIRLDYRLKTGLIEEVEALHQKGVSFEQLKYYGLEYKFIAEFLETL